MFYFINIEYLIQKSKPFLKFITQPGNGFLFILESIVYGYDPKEEKNNP